MQAASDVGTFAVGRLNFGDLPLGLPSSNKEDTYGLVVKDVLAEGSVELLQADSTLCVQVPVICVRSPSGLWVALPMALQPFDYKVVRDPAEHEEYVVCAMVNEQTFKDPLPMSLTVSHDSNPTWASFRLRYFNEWKTRVTALALGEDIGVLMPSFDGWDMCTRLQWGLTVPSSAKFSAVCAQKGVMWHRVHLGPGSKFASLLASEVVCLKGLSWLDGVSLCDASPLYSVRVVLRPEEEVFLPAVEKSASYVYLRAWLVE